MRLFCVSDIHVDYKENLEWVERHASRVREEMGTIDHDDGQPYGSILLVAGDVCDDVDQFRKVRWWWIVLLWWSLCVDTDTDDVEYSRLEHPPGNKPPLS